VTQLTNELKAALPDAQVEVTSEKDQPTPTGAFEVYSAADKKTLIFSKKQSGRFPTIDEITAALKKLSA